MVWAIIGATGRKPDFIVGKPNPYMLVIICEANGLLPENICVVGDVPESDMRMASSFGTLGILFDPENRFPDFPTRVRELPELLSFLT
jgi:ribonucleotide monophosphatase NagD (HAD superfamily)